MKAIIHCIFITSTVLIIQSCAVGNKYALDSAEASLEYRGKKDVAVAVYDARPYILSGKKSRSFIGLQRGGFGNPFDVTTASQNSLADDMSRSVANTMQKSGYVVTTVDAEKARGEEDAVKLLAGKSIGNSILLIIDEWKSDRYGKTTLYYDLTMKVLSGKGNTLGKSHLSGEDVLSGSPFESVPVALGGKLKQLLNSQDIRDALQ